MSVEGHHHHVVAVDLDNKVATEADIAAAALLTQQLRQELLQLERDLEVAVGEENEAKIAFELQSYEMNQSKDALRDNDEIMELLEEAKQLPRPSNITDLEVSKKFPLQMQFVLLIDFVTLCWAYSQKLLDTLNQELSEKELSLSTATSGKEALVDELHDLTRRKNALQQACLRLQLEKEDLDRRLAAPVQPGPMTATPVLVEPPSGIVDTVFGVKLPALF
jgi:DNA repair exonuclease SbcCD ATPase subunit